MRWCCYASPLANNNRFEHTRFFYERRLPVARLARAAKNTRMKSP